MMWRLDGSTPSARAGSVAVARFTQRIMTAVSGAFQFRATAASSTTISARLSATRNCTTFWMLRCTRRPSRTAYTMVVKRSSRSTMSAASFATSVPVMPMATPMSAALSAGASFTPSPVMAVTSPSCLSARTMRSLW